MYLFLARPTATLSSLVKTYETVLGMLVLRNGGEITIDHMELFNFELHKYEYNFIMESTSPGGDFHIRAVKYE